MSTDNEKKFLRLFMFAHKVCLPVVRAFFKSNVLNRTDYDNDFIKFLEKHTHELYHLMETKECCQCQSLSPVPCRRFKISMRQFKTLYEIGAPVQKHIERGSEGILRCVCGISVDVSCRLEHIDLSFLHSIIKHCIPLQYSHEMWLDAINKQRNKICHTSEINALAESKIETMWGKLEGSVLGLVEDIKPYPEYKDTITMQIELLKEKDYELNSIKPLIEAMKSELNNNINGLVQQCHQELTTRIDTHAECLSVQSKTNKEEIENHISASTETVLESQEKVCSTITAQAATLHSKQIDVIKKLMHDIESIIENKDVGLLNSVREEIKKVTMQHHNKELQFDIQVLTPSECTAADLPEIMTSTNEDKCRVLIKISTPGSLDKEKEKIVKILRSAVDIIKVSCDGIEIKFVEEGSITAGTLVPRSLLQDENMFKRAIKAFLDEMIKVCQIDTSIPLVVKVKIFILDRQVTGPFVKEPVIFIPTTTENEVETNVTMQHHNKELQFDIDVRPPSECTAGDIAEKMKCLTKTKGKGRVMVKVETEGVLDEEKEEIVALLRGATDTIRSKYDDIEIKFVKIGSIIIGLLVSNSLLEDEDRFKRTIKRFLDEIVKVCKIDTSIPLVIKVKIFVLDSQLTGPFVKEPVTFIPTTIEKEVQTNVAESRRRMKPLIKFDVVFMNADDDKEISLVAKASAYLEGKCGLKCAIPGRDYMYGVVTQDDISNYLKKCNSVILTYSMKDKPGFFQFNDKNMIVLIDDLEKCSLDLSPFIPLEVSTCEHIWLYHLAKVLVEMSPSSQYTTLDESEEDNYKEKIMTVTT